jgi:hypothetical protein
MDFEQGLTTELTATAGLTNKVYPVSAQQGSVAPYVVYTLGNAARNQTLEGHDGLVKPQYQLDVYHSSYTSLKALMKLIIANIKTYKQRNIGGTGPYVQQVEIMNELITYDSGLLLHKGIIEFNADYEEE